MRYLLTTATVTIMVICLIIGFFTLAMDRKPPIKKISANNIVPDDIKYPYDFSPIVTSAEFESSLSDANAAELIEHFNAITKKFIWLAANEAQSGDQATIRRHFLASREQKQRLMVLHAQALRDYGLIYHEESLLSRAFDPELHQGDFYHLDCDLLSYAFMHTAYYWQLPLYPILGNNHLYLEWNDGTDKFWVDATEFQKVEQAGTTINYQSGKIGDHFFIPEDFWKKKVTFRDKEFRDRGYYFQHLPTDILAIVVKNNVLVGLFDHAETMARKVELCKHQHELAEAKPYNGTYTNCYAFHRNIAADYLSIDDYASAIHHLRFCVRFKEEPDIIKYVSNYNIYADQIDLAEAYLETNQLRLAYDLLRKVHRQTSENRRYENICCSLDDTLCSYLLGRAYKAIYRYRSPFENYWKPAINFCIKRPYFDGRHEILTKLLDASLQDIGPNHPQYRQLQKMKRQT